ncbi:hypothetical protein PHYBLDRAFT_172603 [Phycomyces blakesleeanus NRRL 1555(-)]|uniref:Retrotransposon gag domain-containing protein n=1 Tax=Phycomyces blakesleeanus (strain ATCC 8743b / DSM 1359 / FGSC 10004 / NBRC 33097 / NRRL 1555) TaxID=763407 RepID=A0A162ZVT2_PHYB8|nr:hypothetical protein PHYBLDRAFT_172603 [Phycomyces blakesleeanus NRRL 1555(-)]OAD69351.1 hypothetical protein PHYBLDRAFT_172603 [Phycomyces blakesleeanus NRRL 1555(-)]|eukprot:XP_018287391.1 hypothetical protein PHYBLDRAFT_172603 [Phycomyces blakesleeanus NRRL 1555(-)]
MSEQPQKKQKPTIPLEDIPVLKLKTNDKQANDSSVYANIHYFIYAFERKLIENAMLPFDGYWEEALKVSCKPPQLIWFDRVLANRGLTWETARAQLEKDYGDETCLETKKQAFNKMTQRRDEQVSEFADRFLELMKTCCIHGSPELVNRFANSLHYIHRSKAHNIIHYHFGPNPTEDIERIFTTVKDVFDNGPTSSRPPSKKPRRA